MKLLYVLALGMLLSFTAQAQPEINLTVSASVVPIPVDLPNGGVQNSPFNIPQGTVQSFTFTIQNKGTSDLTLSKTSGFYAFLSGNAATEVVLDESGITPTVAAGGSVSFTVTSKSTTPPGDYSLVLSLANDDSDENPYGGTVNYTIVAITSVVSAQEAGISIFPNPSADGHIKITGNVTIDKIMVYGLNGNTEEFAGATSFTTKQKGLLVVHVYTNKGIVAEKIRVQ